MSPIDALLRRAELSLLRVVAPPARVRADGPAAPIDSPRGPTGIQAVPAPCPPLPPENSRSWHRLGWFSALARSAPTEAAARLRLWLASDVPGDGPAWEHRSDAAVRLAHLAAGLSWGGGVEAGLNAAIAGSVAWHLRVLSGTTPVSENDGLRAVCHHAGLVIGGFLYPELEESASARRDGLAGLRFGLPRQLHADGSSRDLAPRALGQALMLVAVARTMTRANGAAFPTSAEAALVAGARFLERLGGDLGYLPPLGVYGPEDLLPGVGGGGRGLWSYVVGAGLQSGEAGPELFATALGAGGSEGQPEPSSGSTWAMWTWRESGVVAAFLKVKSQPSRVIANFGAPRPSEQSHHAPMSVLWELGDLALLADPGTPGDDPGAEVAAGAVAHGCLQVDGRPEASGAVLDVARVDGKKARIEGHHEGWRLSRSPLRHERELLLNQARLLCTDRLVSLGRSTSSETLRLCWQLGPGFAVERAEKGFIAKNGKIQLQILLPTALEWSVELGGPTFGRVWTDAGFVSAPALVGTGTVESGAELVSSFEVR